MQQLRGSEAQRLLRTLFSRNGRGGSGSRSRPTCQRPTAARASRLHSTLTLHCRCEPSFCHRRRPGSLREAPTESANHLDRGEQVQSDLRSPPQAWQSTDTKAKTSTATRFPFRSCAAPQLAAGPRYPPSPEPHGPYRLLPRAAECSAPPPRQQAAASCQAGTPTCKRQAHGPRAAIEATQPRRHAACVPVLQLQGGVLALVKPLSVFHGLAEREGPGEGPAEQPRSTLTLTSSSALGGVSSVYARK